MRITGLFMILTSLPLHYHWIATPGDQVLVSFVAGLLFGSGITLMFPLLRFAQWILDRKVGK